MTMLGGRDLSEPAIIVPAYRRLDALSRLLNSINRAHFPDDGVRLIISLDGGATDAVVDRARNFNFNGGSAEVIERAEQLGLREHILWCGNQAREHGSVIILEDDLVVEQAVGEEGRELDNSIPAQDQE